jgi:quercetin dioxygenase-like cupin family protein
MSQDETTSEDQTMSEPRALRFGDMAWEDDVPGIRDRAATVDGARWAVVEYAAGAAREEWCEDGHRGLVLDGAIEYEFDDGREKLVARSGQAFLLPSGIAHRGRNLADGPTQMFLIDDVAGA